MRRLDVYMYDIPAGVLTETYPGRDYVFTYKDEYLNSSNPAISVSLPKREKAYISENMFPFFANMLPEGANRKVICRDFRIDETDFFGILTTMADKDFIGAVQLKKMKDDGD